tara:strand:+ start:10140 stop:12986 length:2847 start_codon:yes stop_codon:yes gene_type:complete
MKINNTDRYPISTPESGDIITGSKAITGETLNFDVASFTGEQSLLQNNKVKLVTTAMHTAGDVWDTINGTDFSIGVTTIPIPTTYYEALDVDNIIWRVPSVVNSGNLGEIRYEHYLMLNTGKGKYGVGGEFSLEKEDLFLLNSIQVAQLPSDFAQAPIIYTFYDENLDDPEVTLNAQAGSYPTLPSIGDYYVFIIKPSITLGGGEAQSALYKFVGSAGDYGNSGGVIDTAIDTDFLAIEVNNDYGSAQQITVRKMVVSSVINGTGVPNDNISLAVNRSITAPSFSISPNEILIFEAHISIAPETVGGNYSLGLEKYIWTRGEAVVSANSVEADYELIYDRNLTEIIIPPTTASANQTVYSLGAIDIDAPHTALNAEAGSYVVDPAVNDTLFIVYETNVFSATYKIYKFIGSAGDYGNSGAPVNTSILADFQEIEPLTAKKAKIKYISQLINDKFYETNTAYVDGANGNDGTGEYQNPKKPFLTVASALSALPIPSASEEALFNQRLFTVHILDDTAQTINVFTEHNLRFYCENGASLTLENTGTGFGQTNFGADSAVGKEIVFDMPRSYITLKKTTSGNAVVCWNIWTNVYFNVEKIFCETIDPIDYGMTAGFITGHIFELICDKSGLSILARQPSQSMGGSNNPRELVINRLTMNNTVVSGQNEIASNIDCNAISYDNSAGNATFFNLFIKYAFGQGATKAGLFTANGRFANYFKITVQYVSKLRLFDKATDFHVHFDNTQLVDVCIGTVDKSTSFGGSQTLFTGHIGMWTIDYDTWARFNLYDHICYNATTTDGHTLKWEVTNSNFRVTNEPVDPNDLKAVVLFDAPNDLRTITNNLSGSTYGSEAYSGIMFINAKFFDCKVRIFGESLATVTKVGNPTLFDKEKLVFFGDCIFESNGEFLTLDNPAMQKRIEVRGSLKIGANTVWNTAGNLELETLTTTPADIIL